jgi:sulfate transport system substrate-binding protein
MKFTRLTHRWLRWLRAALPAICLFLLGAYAFWPWLPFSPTADTPRTLIVYGFSITGDVMNRAIFPAFQAKWLTQTGEQVEFVGAFAGSGTITNQLIMGVPADIALLALESDAQRLVKAGVVVADSWHHLPQEGRVSLSPIVILTRPGNPLHIQDFADLTGAVDIIHPDPLTSGAANWAIMAEYGAGIQQQPDNPQAGHDMLLGIWRNVIAQASSARAARTQFENGFGDALITYEQDVLPDVLNGRLDAELIYPASTIFSEYTVVVVDQNIDPQEQDLVDAFIAFLWSEDAQRLFTQFGFRSVDEALNQADGRFPTITDPFYISDFGGWQQAKSEIIESVWKNQVLQEIAP